MQAQAVPVDTKQIKRYILNRLETAAAAIIAAASSTSSAPHSSSSTSQARSSAFPGHVDGRGGRREAEGEEGRKKRGNEPGDMPPSSLTPSSADLPAQLSNSAPPFFLRTHEAASGRTITSESQLAELTVQL
ncbi:hypothetical protein Naga_101539g2 [Nannochloropsis gaditana]|uniref:Uncharacterized protein n=1 Tax=Nannochloropsis gaditana TaxID=72520 RepID=W7SZK8_9STRA|nr:hypothetical protein Naga_101539g2 [Nannochloropsis gaditana]